MNKLTLVQNGFYSREKFSLKNLHIPYTNPYLLNVDERLFRETGTNGKNVFQEENLLYKAN
jgi:hypothetical protein